MEDRLIKFVRLIDAGSFTKAARELHLSQPALSVAIAKLERELHIELLVRSSHPLTLTEAGKLVYTAGNQLTLHIANLKQQLSDLSIHEPVISMGMIDSVSNTFFTSPHTFSELEKKAKLSVIVNNSRYLLQAVERDELDVAFITEPPTNQQSVLIEISRIASEQLVIVCHAQKLDSIEKALRSGYLPQFISYDQGSTTQSLISKVLRSIDITVEPVFFSTSPEGMFKLVLLQKGVAALPYSVVEKSIRDGTVVVVGNPEPIIIERHICSIKRRGKELPNFVTATTLQLRQAIDSSRLPNL